jgi:multidrug efflux system membrane fusion protein
MTESNLNAAPAKPPRRARRRLVRWILAVSGIAAAIVAVDFRLTDGFGGKPVTAATPPAAVAAVPVVTALAKGQDLPIYLTGLGTVQGDKTVTIKARVDGQIEKIGFTEGQDVKQGDLIAQIDPRPLEAQKAQAEAQLARDEALLANAQLDLQRFASLLKSDFASHQSVDTQKALVAQYQAAVKTDQAQIEYASIQLGFATITAPISGRTGVRLVDDGNIVHATDTTGIVVITQIEPIAATFSVPEDALDDIRKAMAAGTLTAEAYARNDTTPRAIGKLLLVDNEIDPASGSLKLKVEFPNTDHALWPGQFISVRLLLGTRKDSVTVPAAAVQRGPNGTYAYVVKADGTAVMAPITVGLIRDGIALIDKGLAAGDRVVVDGQYKLKPGVRIAAAPSATADAGVAQ